MFSLCTIAACEQCVSEIMCAVMVSSSGTLMYCQSIRHMPLGPRRGCPGDRDLPAAGEEARVDTGDCVEAGVDLVLASQDMLCLQFYPVLTSFLLARILQCTYVYFYCPVLTLVDPILLWKDFYYIYYKTWFILFLWLICIVLLILIAFLHDVLVRNDEIKMFNQYHLW